MRLVRTVAHARASAPRHAVIFGGELRQLRQLPGWVRWLFVELVQLSDFETGRGRSSWAQLVALLDFDAMPGRPPAGAAVSMQQIRRGFAQLEAAGLVARDGFANEQTGALFFEVAPRHRRGVPADSFDRGFDRGAAAPEASSGAGSEAPEGGLSTGVSTGVTEPIHSTRATPVDNSDGPSPEVRERLRAARDRVARGGDQAPPGAQNVAR